MGIENPFSQTLGIFSLHDQQWIYGLIFHFRSQIYKVTINFPLLISDYIFRTYVWVEKVWNTAIVTSVKSACMWLYLTQSFWAVFHSENPYFRIYQFARLNLRWHWRKSDLGTAKTRLGLTVNAYLDLSTVIGWSLQLVTFHETRFSLKKPILPFLPISNHF